jgi:hypothetical protein
LWLLRHLTIKSRNNPAVEFSIDHQLQHQAQDLPLPDWHHIIA